MEPYGLTLHSLNKLVLNASVRTCISFFYSHSGLISFFQSLLSSSNPQLACPLAISILSIQLPPLVFSSSKTNIHNPPFNWGLQTTDSPPLCCPPALVQFSGVGLQFPCSVASKTTKLIKSNPLSPCLRALLLHVDRSI